MIFTNGVYSNYICEFINYFINISVQTSVDTEPCYFKVLSW